ncbi:N-acetyl-gamma-glutamyl-phosphate reductase [Desulfurococcaceae archaeon AG1]|jgi:N-acetyl-gamma-glutamyl-phosphate/LysW-gamma-L-alpha-aminoadipyl-6-phosphate reductase|nr:N-acetyl-gamma-glutamyl-phosphate reductase [Desulfurococcaceae archaeon AG1]
MVRVCVVGGSGYTGGELLRYLSMHREAEVKYVTSREYAGKPIHFAHPNLKGFYKGLRFENLSVDKILGLCDAVFFSTPLEVSLEYIPKVVESGVKVIDLSPAFRLKDPDLFKAYYEIEHKAPDLARRAVYGLPEIHIYREALRGASLIASPGCNATAAIISIYPLAYTKKISYPVVIDVKAGSSEAGAKPTPWDHHPERASSTRPYSPKGHRHVAEVLQLLREFGESDDRVSLIPHAVPIVRGVLSSTHLYIDIDEQELVKIYVERYAGSPFIRILWGSPTPYPDPKNLVGTNIADIGFAVEERARRVSIFVALDNLGKGAAGQALQAFNISLGIDEREGLWIPPTRPV